MRESSIQGEDVDEPSQEFRRHGRALLGCTLAASMGVIGLNAYTSGSFLPALVKSAHYSRAQVSFATLLLSVVVALVAPIVGLAVDRWGASRVIALAIIGEAFGFAVLASAPAEFALFAGATVFLAVLGAGTTPPGFSRIIATRFDKRRGLALGVMISGVGVTAVVAPLVVTPVVGAFGWRAGYLLLCGAVLVLGGSGLFLIGRDRPSPRTKASNSGTASGWRALRKPLYWLVIIGFATPALCGGGFLLHLITILRQRGFSPFQAAQVQALVGVSIIVGRLSTGFVMDRIFAGYVAGITFALSAIGTALLLSTNGAILCVAALAIGLNARRGAQHLSTHGFQVFRPSKFCSALWFGLQSDDPGGWAQSVHDCSALSGRRLQRGDRSMCCGLGSVRTDCRLPSAI